MLLFRKHGVVRTAPLALLLALLSGCVVVQPMGGTTQSSPTAASTAATTAGGQASAAAVAQAPASSLSARPGSAAPASDALTALKGSFDYTNDVINAYYVEHAVALTDMYGFVTRDRKWEIPVAGQTLGNLDLDEAEMHGSYTLQLPALPRGTPVDVDNDSDSDRGVQVFAVSYAPNLTGGPFSVGDDRSEGWPSYLASTVNDPENNDEVTGGKLVVWAPDAEQQFPTAFGADGLLFTSDDPVGPIPAGYSLVDLGQQPFGISQQDESEVTLYEPADAGVKDFSELSFTEAWDRMFERVRREYAFNGIEGKEPAWDELSATLRPRVQEAERQNDPRAFYAAMVDFVRAFRDGHVGLVQEEFGIEIVRQRALGGYGMTVQELDDKRVLVDLVVPDGPAELAGIERGAEIKRWNNQPIDQAISAVDPTVGPGGVASSFSTEFGRRAQQLAYLVRAPIGTQVNVVFANDGAADETVTLRASDELDSLYAAFGAGDSDPTALPVESSILESGAGYVRLNSNYDDLGLIIRLFERALDTFQNNGVDGIILDLRNNGGGAPLGLAGYLTDQEIPLAQLQYFSDRTGAFEADGPPDTFRPNQRQFRFTNIAVLVDKECASACEIEAYGFSRVPNAIVIGQYPTAGVEAEVSRGQYELPADMTLQVPTGRFVLPDGSLFLEGKGVEPTQRVPIDEQTVLSDEDVVLQAAEEAVTQ